MQCVRVIHVCTQIGADGIHDFPYIGVYTDLFVRTVSHMPSADRLSAYKVVTADQVRFVLNVNDIQTAPEGMERIPVIEVQRPLHLFVHTQFIDTPLQQVTVLVIIGIVYIIARSAGKIFGAGISSKMTKCDDNIVKYLGITLLPQAGVALGMAIKATDLGEHGNIVRNITLFAVLIYEIVGPFLTKVALTKAGDIKAEGQRSARGEGMNKPETNIMN